MNEHDWLTCADPQRMLVAMPQPSDRKLRLWVEACMALCSHGGRHSPEFSPRYWATATDHDTCTKAARADLLRHIVGNPFRPAWAVKCSAIGRYHGDRCSNGRVQCSNAQFKEDCRICHGRGYLPGTRPDLPAAVVSLAEACRAIAGETKECGRCGGKGNVYQRGPRWITRECPDCHGTGTVPADTPYFALHDALLDAGLPELAEHFGGCPSCQERTARRCVRCGHVGPTEHPRGCWVLDAILNQE